MCDKMPTKYVNEGHWCTCFVMLVSIKVELVLEFDDILTTPPLGVGVFDIYFLSGDAG